MKKLSIIIVSIFILVTLISCSSSKKLTISDIEKLREEYPLCEEFDQSMSINVTMLKAIDLEYMVTEIDGPIVIGEIINKPDNIIIDTSSYDNIDKDSSDSVLKKRDYNVKLLTYAIYEIKISEIIREGSDVKIGQTIKIAIPAFLNATGLYKKNLKGVFMMSDFTSPLLKEYYQTSRFGFLYITDDDYVLGAYPNKLSEDYSGVSLEFFKREIKNILKKNY